MPKYRFLGYGQGFVKIPNAVIVPLAQCKYEDAVYPCPRDNTAYVRNTYGADWKTPRPKYSPPSNKSIKKYRDYDGVKFEFGACPQRAPSPNSTSNAYCDYFYTGYPKVVKKNWKQQKEESSDADAR